MASADEEHEAFLARCDLAAEALATPRKRPKLFTRCPPPWRRDAPFNIVNLLGACSHPHLPSHRLVLLMVFLLVVKDRGSALRFEPHRFPEEECGEDDDRVGFRMLYEVDGTEYELVPPPHCLMDLISLDLEALAGLDQPKALIANALRRLASKIDGEAPVPREGGFVARLGEIDLNIEVCVFSTELGESYHLQFPLVSEQASDVAQQELVGVCEPSEDRLDSGSRELDPPGRT